MKHLMTLAALFVSSLAMAQDYPEYPFPYNPDGNADGYIGLTDLLDLLVVYGQEYPGSFYGDSTGAVLHLGEMPVFQCVQEAKAAGRHWRVLTYSDLMNQMVPVMEIGQSLWPGGGTSSWNFGFHVQDHLGRFYYNSINYTSNSSSQVINLPGGGSAPANVNFGTTIRNFYESVNLNKYHCIIATEALPEIEYELLYDPNAVADSLSNGWKPLGGFDGVVGQTLWRYAD